jgi:hypothetical protein
MIEEYHHNEVFFLGDCRIFRGFPFENRGVFMNFASFCLRTCLLIHTLQIWLTQSSQLISPY